VGYGFVAAQTQLSWGELWGFWPCAVLGAIAGSVRWSTGTESRGPVTLLKLALMGAFVSVIVGLALTELTTFGAQTRAAICGLAALTAGDILNAIVSVARAMLSNPRKLLGKFIPFLREEQEEEMARELKKFNRRADAVLRDEGVRRKPRRGARSRRAKSGGD
jgi:hypothetical protein